MADQPHYQQYPYQQYPNQQYPHPQYPYGQQQEAAAGYGNWNNGAQQAPPQWYRQPAVYAAEGIARAHNWVASQPEDSLSPPPTAKTPFSEYASTVSDHRTIGSHPFPQGPPPRRDQTERICGVKRNVFFIVLAIGLFVLVVGIATGLGVGLALAKSSASTSTAVTPAATSSASSSTSSTSSAATTKSATPTEATSTTTSSSTLTLTSPTPSFTGTLISGTVECPDDNGSVYVSSGSSKPFNIECGRDYNSRDGAKDMSNKPIASMAGCIDYCGSTSGCVGVGWGNYQGTITCWLKSELGEPNESDSWYFARLQDLGN